MRRISPALLALCILLPACGEAPAIDMSPGAARADAIIGGQPAGRFEFPSVGVLLISGVDAWFGEFASMSCTGTLIAPDAVLLAGHCVDTSVYGQVEDLTFYFSFETDVSAVMSPADLPADAIPVVDAVAHPSFTMSAFDTPTAGLGDFYDVAIAFLETEATGRQTAVVMEEDDADGLIVGTEVEIVGYGQRDAEPYSQNVGIQYKALSVINEVGDSEIQIGDAAPTPQKCHGDSGGPTFLDYDDGKEPATRLIGITSHAYDETDCLKGGVDTRADTYLEWINTALMDGCSRGVRLACDDGGGLAAPVLPGGGGGSGGGGIGGPVPYLPPSKDGCSGSDPGLAPWLAGLLLLGLRRRKQQA